MQGTKRQTAKVKDLPPLILHPLADESSPEGMLEGSRANLMLHGLLPHDSQSDDELIEKVARSRYMELRMLYFVGKDLERWLTQCVEFSEHDHDLAGRTFTNQSFASYLIESTPPGVRNKLLSWGVVDYRNIFVRALGMRSVFHELPSIDMVSRTFLLDYHRFTDYLYACRQQLSPFSPIPVGTFDFEIYASAEYSQILEKQWNEAGI